MLDLLVGIGTLALPRRKWLWLLQVGRYRRLHADHHIQAARVLAASLRAAEQERRDARPSICCTRWKRADEYLVVKWLHILSSTVLFGTGLGSAFYMFVTSWTRDARVVAAVVRYVVIADYAFTTPAIIIQPVTGLYLIHLAGFPLSSTWIAVSIALVFSRRRGVAAGRMDADQDARYGRERRRQRHGTAAALLEFPEVSGWRWNRAFSALVVVFYLMVAKPV